MEARLLEMEKSKDKLEAELKEKIQSLEKELENANDLLSDPRRGGATIAQNRSFFSMFVINISEYVEWLI